MQFLKNHWSTLAIEKIMTVEKSLGLLLDEFLSDIKLRARCNNALQFEFTQFLSPIYLRQSPEGVHCHITVCSACKCILKHISSVYGMDSTKGVYHFGHEHAKWLSKSQMDLAKRMRGIIFISYLSRSLPYACNFAVSCIGKKLKALCKFARHYI